MSKFKQTFFLLIEILLLNTGTFAQIKSGDDRLSKIQHWQLLDYGQDTVYGTSVNRAYNDLLKGKISSPVIVAVIDEGVDIFQEDLQGHIWTNLSEIPGNGIDDDHNGYTDDIHGWNFLGGKDGKMIYATNSEADREYARLLPRYSAVDAGQAYNKKEYAYFLEVKKRHIADSIGRGWEGSDLSHYLHLLESARTIIQKTAGKRYLFYNDVEIFQPQDSTSAADKNLLLDFYNQNGTEFKLLSLDSGINMVRAFIVTVQEQRLLYKEVKSDPLESRREIIGDNPFDIGDKNYGNNIVGDKYADHGTHCAGIISGIRKNGIGIDGIADNVLIMPVRAVNTLHFGDEMDKDIALAIRYAVDNGAKIINMSFGKNYSPQKGWVDDAVQYASKKNVLLVHAAMNDNTNNDSTAAFPNPWLADLSERAKNFITVGAITSDTGLSLPANFSNYGQKEVDLFAPGVAIYSSVPGNKYEFKSGTSMAAPVVSGVAALILEYYPDLSAEQLKEILMASVISLKNKIVYKPGTKEKVDFGTLCVSGGIVNAYNALRLAAKFGSKK